MLRSNTFFYCAMTFVDLYSIYTFHKSNRVCFEKYKSGISFEFLMNFVFRTICALGFNISTRAHLKATVNL